MTTGPLEAVDRFLEAIHDQDLERISRLVAPDHRFVDSLGNRIVGREAVRAAWKHYFTLVHGYRITVEWQLEAPGAVALFGSASGSTFAPNGSPRAWSTPIAIHARVEQGLITEWRVFADNEPVRAILRQARAV